MKITYESCDGKSIREEEITKATFFTSMTSNKVYVNCQRAKNNPLYNYDDKFKNKFELEASEIIWIK